MYELLALVVIGSAIWALVDAPTHGLSRWWAAGILLLWIVAFPWYLASRSRIAAIDAKGARHLSELRWPRRHPHRRRVARGSPIRATLRATDGVRVTVGPVRRARAPSPS